MTDMLELLLAEREISRQLTTYCRAMDRNDPALAEIVFHPDSVVDYGVVFAGTGKEFMDFIMASHPYMDTHVHRIMNVSINVDGDRAGSECYVDARFLMTDADGQKIERNTCGRFIDQWERYQGRWMMLRRTYLHCTDSARVVEEPMFSPGGSRDTSDPSYAVLA
jgi:hypothetical protein